ncbi:MAG: CHASE2 domain-containing protein [Oscillatoria sp. SIO1A7]|nr:CHASE2 domain-containing protein [Oscillatoria sp. SIO1A7]
MQKLVKLSLEGQIDGGYKVELEIKKEGKDGRTLAEGVKGSLSSANLIYERHQQWQDLYKALATGGPSVRALQKRGHKMPTNISVSACQQAANNLKAGFNQWLSDPNFTDIDRTLLRNLEPEDKIRFVIKTTDYKLWQLPWSAWKFFEEYPNAEVGFSPSEFKGIEKPIDNRRRKQVRIMAVGGDSTGINYKQDQESLRRLRSVGAEPEILNDLVPSKFRDNLWNKKWDILFYAGHSDSKKDLETGQIHLTNSDILEPKELENALKAAKDNGLKIFIFNSCRGLGLARKLVADYEMPVVIAMREPVPDKFAAEFAQYFLIEYAWKKQPLYLAVRQARQRLIDEWQDKLPSIEWLPVICQNPAIRPPTWAELHREVSVREVGVASLACASLVLLARFLGLLEPVELWAFDRTMQMRPNEGSDPRITVVEIDRNYIGDNDYPIKDGELARLLKKLEQYKPRLMGLDIYRDKKNEPGYAQLFEYMQQSDRLVAVCKAPEYDPKNPTDSEGSIGIAPPLGLPKDFVSFSDVVADGDGLIRRHLLSMQPDESSVCQASSSFGWFLALYYLYLEGIEYENSPEGDLQVKDAIFKRLKSDSGPYQRVDAVGYQTTLNYRSVPYFEDVADRVTIQEVLNDDVDPRLLEDRIVIIGMTADSATTDIWSTQYPTRKQHQGNKIPGVFIQAHMVSQIVSAVLDGRPLIWFWPQLGEILWILGWSVAGGIFVLFIPSPLGQKLAIGTSFGVLYGLCLLSLIEGVWLPLVPPALALVSTSGVLAAWTKSESS